MQIVITKRLGLLQAIWMYVSDVKTKISLAKSRENSVERVFRSYCDSLYRLAYSYLHNKEDAEEMVQEVMLKYIEHAPKLESDSHEKAWLFRVTANLSKNRIKYNAYRKTDELNEDLVASGETDLSFVWEAVKALPEQYREVLHLFYYEGMKTAQIAALLSKNESSVRSCLMRGREKLKELLKEDVAFEEI